MKQFCSQSSRQAMGGYYPGGVNYIPLHLFILSNSLVLCCVLYSLQIRVSLTDEYLQLLPEGPDSAAPQLYSGIQFTLCFDCSYCIYELYTTQVFVYREVIERWLLKVSWTSPGEYGGPSGWKYKTTSRCFPLLLWSHLIQAVQSAHWKTKGGF